MEQGESQGGALRAGSREAVGRELPCNASILENHDPDSRRRRAPPLLAMWAADGPAQPLPFSHKDHAGTLKLQCKMCHPSPDPGESMTIAPPSVCMQCHSAIKTDSPAIQKLAQYAAQGKPVPWVRIYAIPAWVDFSHRAHLEAQEHVRGLPRQSGRTRCPLPRGQSEYGHVHGLPRRQAGAHRLQFLSRAALEQARAIIGMCHVIDLRRRDSRLSCVRVCASRDRSRLAGWTPFRRIPALPIHPA